MAGTWANLSLMVERRKAKPNITDIIRERIPHKDQSGRVRPQVIITVKPTNEGTPDIEGLLEDIGRQKSRSAPDHQQNPHKKQHRH